MNNGVQRVATDVGNAPNSLVTLLNNHLAANPQSPLPANVHPTVLPPIHQQFYPMVDPNTFVKNGVPFSVGLPIPNWSLGTRVSPGTSVYSPDDSNTGLYNALPIKAPSFVPQTTLPRIGQ